MKFIFAFFIMLVQVASLAQIPNYVIDDTFDSGDFYTYGGILQLLNLEDGKIFVSGDFDITHTEAGGRSIISEDGDFIFDNTTFSDYGGFSNHIYNDGYISCGIAIFLITGDLHGDYSFEFEYQKSAYNGFLGNDALDALVEPDNSILVGGRFFTDSVIHNNIESLRQLVRVDSTGAPDPDFPMLNFADPIDAKIHTMDTLSDGSLIISGDFYDFGGYPYNHVGKLNSDFTVDTTFVNSLLPGGEAFIRFIDSEDRIWLQLYSIDGVSGPLGNSYAVVRLLPNGELDTTFTIPSVVFPPDNEDQGYIWDIVELPSEKFILTGEFYFVNGYSRTGIVMINEDGSIVPDAFENFGADEAIWGIYDEPPAVGPIELLDNGKLLIGGSFSSFGGEPYNCLVRLKPDGFVGVNEKPQRNTLNIYPNPARESIRIRLPDKNQGLTRVEFYDLSGRLVKKLAHLSENTAIDVSDLTDGLYLVEGTTGEGIFCGKVVINQK